MTKYRVSLALIVALIGYPRLIRDVNNTLAQWMAKQIEATAGLLVKKAFQKAVKELENRDATDEAFRNLIESEISRIERHVQGFTESFLPTSVDFLGEGVRKLNRVIKTALPRNKDDTADKEVSERIDENCVTDGPGYAAAAIKELKLTDLSYSTQKLLHDAKDRFRSARIKATEAFNNQTLATDKRILALKIRLMASVLECVDRPEHAVDDCHRCLELLHGMRAVRENFDVQLNGGLRAPFEKKQREEIVFAVCQMNYVAFRIIQVINGGNNAITLPTLEVDREHIDVLRDERAIRELVELKMAELCRGPWVLGKGGKNDEKLRQPCRLTSNCQGQFIVADAYASRCGIKVYSPGGKFLFCFGKIAFSSGPVHSIATDQHDNVYVLADAEGTNREVYVFNQFGIRSPNTTISLEGDFLGISMTVGPKHQLFVLGGSVSENTYSVVIHDINDDEVTQTFGREILKNPKDIAVAESGRVFVLMLPESPVVQIFSEEGDSLQSFQLRGSWCAEGSIGLCRDSQNLVVSLWGRNCSENEKLSIYSAEGETLSGIRVPREKGQRNTAQDVAVSADGRVVAITGTQDSASCFIFTV